MKIIFQKAKEFIYRNARPLDLARWQYHFENGSKEAVINALSYYQNEDGGFGHALEPDAWNPNSSPIQTWFATEILREINFTNNAHPVIQGILNYLASGKDFNGYYWYNIIKSNDSYPHAPWWDTETGNGAHDDYNPTASLAGFIIKYADKNSRLYSLGCRLAKEAVNTYLKQGFLSNMATVLCYIRLLQYVEEAGITDLFDLEALKAKLIKQVEIIITRDTAKWESTYVCKPSLFIDGKESFFYSNNKEIADFECDFIVKTQLDDGSWKITWKWAAYPEEWAISKNWWKANGVIANLLYLRGFNRI